MNTYALNILGEYTVPTTETILSTVNTPYIEQAAVLGIMNNYGSDSIVRIREISINEVIGRTTTALTNLDLWRITALSGGTVIQTTKADSNATTLPSQVSVVKYPTVTTTGSYLRRVPTLTGFSPTTAMMWHHSVDGGSRISGLGLGRMFSSGDSEAQKIILREGEGISLRTTLTSPQNYRVEINVQFSDGTNDHIVNEMLNIGSGTEVFGILNGSGSGIVISISKVEMRLLRTTEIPIFSIETFSDMNDGVTVTPIAMDSTSPVIDSLVEFKQNASVVQGNVDAQVGRNAKQGGDMIPFRRLVEPVFGKGVGLASGALQLRPINNKPFCIDGANNTGEIVLREGQGLGIFQRVNYSGMGNYEFNILFTVEDNGGGGGESSYVF